jgi:hypothetical protein
VPFGFITDHTSNIVVMAALLVRGIGMGFATIPLTGTAYIGLPPADVPSASIITRVVQQVGGSLGTAVMAVILTSAAVGSDPAAEYRQAFWWSVALTAIAVPLCLVLPGRPETDRDEHPSSDAETAGERVPAE